MIKCFGCSIAIDQFQVSLDEAQRVYCGGQNITGNVSIKLSDLPIIATCELKFKFFFQTKNYKNIHIECWDQYRNIFLK